MNPFQWQYQSKAEPVSTDPESPQLDKFLPSYPDKIDRKPSLTVAILAGSLFFVPLVAVPVAIDHFQPSYPDFARAEPPLPDYGQYTVDADLLTQPETGQLDKWEPSYPDFPGRDRPPLPDYGFYTIDPDQLIQPEVPQLDKWIPSFPSFPGRDLPRLFDYTQYATRLEPLILFDKWDPEYPTFPARDAPRLPDYTQYTIDPDLLTQQETGQIDKWIPSYPDFPGREAPRLFDYTQFETRLEPLFLHDKWDPEYPAFPGRDLPLRDYGYSTIDPFILTQPEDITLDKWYVQPSEPVQVTPRLPDYTQMVRFLELPPPVPDQWYPIYPDFIHGEPPLPDYSYLVLDFTPIIVVTEVVIESKAQIGQATTLPVDPGSTTVGW